MKESREHFKFLTETFLAFHSETLDSQRALIEERYEDKINNLQKHLKKFYSEELKVRL